MIQTARKIKFTDKCKKTKNRIERKKVQQQRRPEPESVVTNWNKWFCSSRCIFVPINVKWGSQNRALNDKKAATATTQYKTRSMYTHVLHCINVVKARSRGDIFKCDQYINHKHILLGRAFVYKNLFLSEWVLVLQWNVCFSAMVRCPLINCNQQIVKN